MAITEVITVSDARSRLPQLLNRLRDAGSDAEPVYIGAHRQAAGVLVSVERFQTMEAELEALREKAARREAVASAFGSVAAEGLTPSAAYLHDAEEYMDGTLNADELLRRAIDRHSH